MKHKLELQYQTYAHNANHQVDPYNSLNSPVSWLLATCMFRHNTLLYFPD